MTIFMTEIYVIKPDRLGDLAACVKNFEAFMKKRPDLFKEVKSHRIFSQVLGGNWGGYVEMTEVESMADAEKFYTRAMGDKDFMTEVYAKFMDLIVPGTYSVNIWAPYP
jgi:hypothetical protein